jgi:hypothetical protein
MDRPDWAPESVDVAVPNAARMYDYALGGWHNFAVDRELVKQAEAAVPGARGVAHANRAFLRRLVAWLVDAGVRQFLDIGSGIPTLGNVHEVAHRAAADARVMYVDVDDVAVAHSRAILAGTSHVSVIQADLRTPEDIVWHPEVTAMLDFSQPIAVLMLAVLHFVSDQHDPQAIVARLRQAVGPGSYIAVSHGSPPPHREDDAETVRQLYQRTPTSLHLRTGDQIGRLLHGLDLVEPGIVAVTDWHPDPELANVERRPEILAAVGRKP